MIDSVPITTHQESIINPPGVNVNPSDSPDDLMNTDPSIDPQISPINGNTTGSGGNSLELVDNKNDPGLQEESMNIDPLIDNNDTITLNDSPTILDTETNHSDSSNDPLTSDIQIPTVIEIPPINQLSSINQIPPIKQLPPIDNTTTPGLPSESIDIIHPQPTPRNDTTKSLTESESLHPFIEFINSEYIDPHLEKLFIDLT